MIPWDSLGHQGAPADIMGHQGRPEEARADRKITKLSQNCFVSKHLKAREGQERLEKGPIKPHLPSRIFLKSPRLLAP